MASININALGSFELLTLYSDVLAQLIKKGVIRSTNNPVADYSEFLVSKSLSMSLAPKSSKGFDAIDRKGKKIEIKARRITDHNKSRQLGAFRELDKKHFDYLAGVLFYEDFEIMRAALIPQKIVFDNATYKNHVNAWIFHLRDQVWNIDGVKDITFKLRKKQKAL